MICQLALIAVIYTNLKVFCHSFITPNFLVKKPRFGQSSTEAFKPQNTPLFDSAETTEFTFCGWSNGLSINSDLPTSVREAIDVALLRISAQSGNPGLIGSFGSHATSCTDADDNTATADTVVFFVSSIYESSAYQYDSIFEYIRQRIPSVKYIIGATTGCPVGSPSSCSSEDNSQYNGKPVESEARASVSVILANFAGQGVDAVPFSISTEQMGAYLLGRDGLPEDGGKLLPKSWQEDGREKGDSSTSDQVYALLLATEPSKSSLGAFLEQLEVREGVRSFGSVASAVTSLHVPKVFVSTSREQGWEKSTSGVVGLFLRGNIHVSTISARSCVPVGPLFRVTKASSDGQILEMIRTKTEGLKEGSSELTSSPPLSPLEHLDAVLKELPPDQALNLKKELLVAVVPDSPDSPDSLASIPAASVGMGVRIEQGGRAGKAPEGLLSLNTREFYAQKPCSFDPMTGSITVQNIPSISSLAATATNGADSYGGDNGDSGGDGDGIKNGEEGGAWFQFCARDDAHARQDLLAATELLRSQLHGLDLPSAAAPAAAPPPPPPPVPAPAPAAPAASDGASGQAMVQALLMFGSVERGNKVFRHQHWESMQLFDAMKDRQENIAAGAAAQDTAAGNAADLVVASHSQQPVQVARSGNKATAASLPPIAGLYANGVFSSMSLLQGSCHDSGHDTGLSRGGLVCKKASRAAIMETDSVYALITTKPTLPPPLAGSSNASGAPGIMSATANTDSILKSCSSSDGPDIISKRERHMCNDENDGVIVSKRDPESAQPVRVATMDYFIPEKLPQPKNFLESIVWEREKEVDKMRERFQLTRALSQAKLAGLKYPRRDIRSLIQQHHHQQQQDVSSQGLPLVITEILQRSIHKGHYRAYRGSGGNDDAGRDEWKRFLSQSATDCEQLHSARVIGLGCHVDGSAFKGHYDDITTIKAVASTLPIICNDFVVYVFQLLQAKICGADSVKLMASILSIQDLAYMHKIAKAVDVTPIVVVSSKRQLLDVVRSVPELQAISVSSRNAQLWKIDPGKAGRILSDPEVVRAIAQKNQEMDSSDSDGGVIANAQGLGTTSGMVSATSGKAAETAEAGKVADAEGVSQLPTGLLVFQEGFVDPAELIEVSRSSATGVKVDAIFLGEELLPIAEGTLSNALQRWL